MTTSTPIIPPDSPLQRTLPARNSNLFVAVFAVITVHVIFLAVLLIQGCQREEGRGTGVEGNAFNAEPTVASTDKPSVPAQQAPLSTPVPASPAAATQGNAPATVLVTPPSLTAGSTPAIGEVSPAARLALEPRSTVAAEKPRLETTTTTPASPPLHSDTPTHLTVYVVKAGDTLTKVARNHRTTVTAIRTASGLKTDRILAGQKLKIPEANARFDSHQDAAGTTSAPGAGGDQ